MAALASSDTSSGAASKSGSVGASSGGDAYGRRLIAKHLKDCEKSSDGFSVGLADDDNLYDWDVIINGPEDTLYEGGIFQAKLTFPTEFPYKPPQMRFTTPGFWHPNVYADGRVCISILHEAEEDEFNPEERMDEKWRPIISVEAVILSVISMLSDPNFSSPANMYVGWILLITINTNYDCAQRWCVIYHLIDVCVETVMHRCNGGRSQRNTRRRFERWCENRRKSCLAVDTFARFRCA